MIKNGQNPLEHSEQSYSYNPLEMMYKMDSNVLVASWIDDLGYP